MTELLLLKAAGQTELKLRLLEQQLAQLEFCKDPSGDRRNTLFKLIEKRSAMLNNLRSQIRRL